jgi:uncharacterized membrane protein YdbT with pleckstrin-like domain
MYGVFRLVCERALRVPADPSPPADGSTARVFRAAPAYWTYRLVLWGIGTGLASLAFVLVVGGINISLLAARVEPWISVLVAFLSFLALIAFVIHALLTLAITRLGYEKRWYVVTDRSLRLREGVLIVREMTITIANVQNLVVMQGPIQRALGIADLQVETAGGGGSTGSEHHDSNLHLVRFRGIDNAEEVKALIQERLRRLKDAGLGDHDDRAAHETPHAFIEALREVHAEARALSAAASS